LKMPSQLGENKFADICQKRITRRTAASRLGDGRGASSSGQRGSKTKKQKGELEMPMVSGSCDYGEEGKNGSVQRAKGNKKRRGIGVAEWKLYERRCFGSRKTRNLLLGGKREKEEGNNGG